MPNAPLNSARRLRALWICGQAKKAACPQAPQGPTADADRSGHMMCYKARTSSRATDSREPLQSWAVAVMGGWGSAIEAG